MLGTYIKLARVMKRHIFLLVAVVAFLLTPWFVNAETLYLQPLNDVQYTIVSGSIFQGLGEGLVVATTTVTNIGFQYWYPNINYTFSGASSYCIYEYYSRADFEANPLTLPTANSVCYSSGSTNAGITTDGSGFLSTSTNQSYTFAPFKYYAIAPPPNFVTAGILGTTGAFNFQELFFNPASATTTGGSLYFQVFSGEMSQYFTPDPTFSGFASSTLNTICEPPSNILDVGGGVRYGLCAGGSFLFVPSQTSLSQFSGLSTTIQGKFPFAYFFSAKTTLDALVASSTANSPTYTYSLHDLGIGSTTAIGNILPNITVFSSSTVTGYFPAGTFDLLKGLAGLAIILTLFADIFFTIKGLPRNS